HANPALPTTTGIVDPCCFQLESNMARSKIDIVPFGDDQDSVVTTRHWRACQFSRTPAFVGSAQQAAIMQAITCFIDQTDLTKRRMKLIDRFVSRELIVNVLFAIAVLSLVLVVGN